MEGRVIVIFTLLALCRTNLLHVNLESSNNPSEGLNFSYCKIKNNFDALTANNQQYFQQIRSVIPQKGQHFVSKMAEFYLSTGQDENSHSFLYDKVGIFKFSAASAIGIVLLLFFAIQFAIGIIFSDEGSSVDNKKIQFCLLFIGIIGFGICSAFVILHSVEGLSHIPKIKEGFDQLACSNNLLTNFHTMNNRTYSVYQLPDIILKLETTALGLRMKANRLIWNSNRFLQNPKLMNQLSEKVKNIHLNNELARKDKNSQFIKTLTKFNKQYSALSNGMTKDAQDDGISHWEIQKVTFSLWQQTQAYRTSWLYIREILKNSITVSAEILSEQTKYQVIEWLKIVYIVLIVIVFVSASGIYFIRRHKSNFLKNILIVIIITVSLIALVNALILSAILPYIAWGCEGSNFALTSQDNFIGEISRGHASDDTSKTMKLFSPYSTNKLASIIKQDYKNYFFSLNKTVGQFLIWQSTAPKLLQNLKEYYQKYDNSQQNKNKIKAIALGLTSGSFQGLQWFHAKLQSLLQIIDPQTGEFGSLNPSRVAGVLQNNVDSICVANFNSLYEIRKRMNQIGYGLLCALLFLSIITIRKASMKDFKLDDLDESKIENMSQQTDAEIKASRIYDPSDADN